MQLRHYRPQDEHSTYNANGLLDFLKNRLQLPNDAALARRLGTTPSYISKLRHHRLGITSEILISMQEETNMSIRELRYLGGDFRAHTGKSAAILPPPTTLVSVGTSTAHSCAA